MPDVVPLAEAQRLALSDVTCLPPAFFATSETLGLVLAKTVLAGESVPRFANSAMDGYAIQAADTAGAPVRLSVVGTASAGQRFSSAVMCGEAVRIMTGAPLPAGADAVCKVERTRSVEGGVGVIVDEPVRPGTNVRHVGEDITAGEPVFSAGTPLRPAHIGVLASLGIETVLAYPRPVVGVLSTGDELAIAGGQAPGPGKIRDTNRPVLLAQLACDGFDVVDLGVVGDDEIAMSGILEAAARQCDVIVASGGVSVGDHDVLKVVLRQLGGTSMRYLDIAVRPGKHVALARLGAEQALAFGLPGNPVAALVAYELMVRPALRAMAGHKNLDRPRLSAVADTHMRRRPGPVLHLVRVTARPDACGQLRVRPSGGQDSHMLRAMAAANALALLPDGDGVGAGESVEIMLLDGELG
jgi:molybdenum cofactor synthesis domain-containing protein